MNRLFKKKIKLTYFILIISFVNLLFFHYPFFKFVFKNIESNSIYGILLVLSLSILILLLHAFIFYLIFYISIYAGKFLLTLFFILNTIALYFVNTFGAIIDESMMSNVLNTNYEESSSFFSFKIILYMIVLGVLPSIYILKAKILKETLIKFSIYSFLTLLLIIVIVYVNASNRLWIDKNSKQLGGLAMPWSYSINTSLFYAHQNQAKEQEILLPNATIKDNKKSLVVLVIGESARKENFSLYGYSKNTNPLLSKTANLFHFNATSCDTYTTACLKCILEYKNSNKLYEILPNYLYRNNVEVVWRTTNWGEPPIHIKNFQSRETLMSKCKDKWCDYDEVLLTGLKEQILSSNKNKMLIVLHTSTSHGPTYSKKYPPAFEIFKPVCNTVELAKCSQLELINAYDNTIVYTDFILHKIIEDLKQLKDYNSSMIFVSDHGESLGEHNVYMHGLPKSIAPKVQYEIPFIVWMSDNSKQIKPLNTVTQNHVFHSVLNFLSIESPIYNDELSIFK